MNQRELYHQCRNHDNFLVSENMEESIDCCTEYCQSRQTCDDDRFPASPVDDYTAMHGVNRAFALCLGNENDVDVNAYSAMSDPRYDLLID